MTQFTMNLDKDKDIYRFVALEIYRISTILVFL